MIPRLKQKLYSVSQLADAPREAVIAYDVIWTLIYQPDDIKIEARGANARVALNLLGDIIEQTAGPDVFEHDPRQLSFDDAILDSTEPLGSLTKENS